jgi:hypothetical protein
MLNMVRASAAARHRSENGSAGLCAPAGLLADVDDGVVEAEDVRHVDATDGVVGAEEDVWLVGATDAVSGAEEGADATDGVVGAEEDTWLVDAAARVAGVGERTRLVDASDDVERVDCPGATRLGDAVGTFPEGVACAGPSVEAVVILAAWSGSCVGALVSAGVATDFLARRAVIRFRRSVGSYRGLAQPKYGLGVWLRRSPNNSFLAGCGATCGSERVGDSVSSQYAPVEEDEATAEVLATGADAASSGVRCFRFGA